MSGLSSICAQVKDLTDAGAGRRGTAEGLICLRHNRHAVQEGMDGAVLLALAHRAQHSLFRGSIFGTRAEGRPVDAKTPNKFVDFTYSPRDSSYSSLSAAEVKLSLVLRNHSSSL